MKALAVALAALLSLLLSVAWYRRWRAHREEAASIDLLLRTHGASIRAKQAGQVADESMEARSRARREIADRLKKRSALVASGSSAAKVIELVKRA